MSHFWSDELKLAVKITHTLSFTTPGYSRQLQSLFISFFCNAFCFSFSGLFEKAKKISATLEFHAFIYWLFLCVPANVVTVLYYFQTDPETLDNPEPIAANKSEESEHHIINHIHNLTEELQCYQDKEEWKEIIDWAKFLVQGVAIVVTGVLGLLGNTLSVVVLLKVKINRNFHRLLAGN